MSPTPPAIPPHSSQPTEDPVAMLLACHAEIRAITARIADLVQPSDHPPASLVATAAAIRQFLSTDFTLHAADEDLSVSPRLRRVHGVDDNVVQALDVMKRHHPDIQGVISRLIPVFQTLEREQAKFAQLRPQLAASTERLAALWKPHLALEEETIFPAMRELLTPAELATIAAEMKTRRAQRAR